MKNIYIYIYKLVKSKQIQIINFIFLIYFLFFFKKKSMFLKEENSKPNAIDLCRRIASSLGLRVQWFWK